MHPVVEQLKRFWNELGLNQKVTISVAAFAVVVGSIWLVSWSSRPQFQLLYGRLDPKEMSAIVAIADEEHIPYRIEGGGTSIFVPHEKVYSLRMKLAGQGIPNGGGVGLEIFDRTNFGISDFVQRTNYARAIQGELSRTIAQLRGVRSARVLIVMPENRLLSEQAKIHPTASVFVDTSGVQLSEEAVNSIRFLVASSVEGLKATEVAVVDNNGRVLTQDLNGEGNMGAATTQMRFRQNVELYFSKKVESILGKIVGEGNVVARTSVEIDTQMMKSLEEKYNPDGQVVKTQSVSEDTNSSHDARSGEVAGSDANGAGGATGGSGGATASSGKKKTSSITYDVSRSTTEIVRAPGDFKRVSAAVIIALRQKTDASGKVSPDPRSADEMKRLRGIIANAIGVPNDANLDKTQAVTVEEVPFNQPTVAKGGVTEPLMRIVDVVKNLMAVIIAVAMLAIFFKMLKKNQPAASIEVVGDNAAALPNSGGQEQVGLMSAKQLALGGVTPELLNELIQKKPENISTAIKDWVANTNG